MGALKKWRQEKWVRIGTDGSIKGECGTSKNTRRTQIVVCHMQRLLA